MRTRGFDPGGSLADEVMLGGDGDDTLKGSGGDDTLNGGSGTDTATYADSDVGVTVNLDTNTRSGRTAESDTFSSIEIVTGSSHGVTLTGTNGA